MSEEAPDFEGAESAVLDKGSVHLVVVSSNFHSSVNVAKAVCGTVSTQTTKNNTVVKRISDREEARRDPARSSQGQGARAHDQREQGQA